MGPSCPPGISRVGPENKIFVFGHMIKFGHSSVKIGGYWPCFFFSSTLTSLRSIKTQKNAWLITHIYCR